jgi:hypothetical protein
MVSHLLFHQHLNKCVDIPNNSNFIPSNCNSSTSLTFFLFSTLLGNRKLSAMQVCENDQHYHKLKSGLKHETFVSVVVESEVKLYREISLRIVEDCKLSSGARHAKRLSVILYGITWSGRWLLKFRRNSLS